MAIAYAALCLVGVIGALVVVYVVTKRNWL